MRFCPKTLMHTQLGLAFVIAEDGPNYWREPVPGVLQTLEELG